MGATPGYNRGPSGTSPSGAGAGEQERRQKGRQLTPQTRLHPNNDTLGSEVVILSRLESHPWEAAYVLHGPVDATDSKTYVVPLHHDATSLLMSARRVRSRSKPPATARPAHSAKPPASLANKTEVVCIVRCRWQVFHARVSNGVA